jgi:hypothetical protein
MSQLQNIYIQNKLDDALKNNNRPNYLQLKDEMSLNAKDFANFLNIVQQIALYDQKMSKLALSSNDNQFKSNTDAALDTIVNFSNQIQTVTGEITIGPLTLAIKDSLGILKTSFDTIDTYLHDIAAKEKLNAYIITTGPKINDLIVKMQDTISSAYNQRGPEFTNMIPYYSDALNAYQNEYNSKRDSKKPLSIDDIKRLSDVIAKQNDIKHIINYYAAYKAVNPKAPLEALLTANKALIAFAKGNGTYEARNQLINTMTNFDMTAIAASSTLDNLKTYEKE